MDLEQKGATILIVLYGCVMAVKTACSPKKMKASQTSAQRNAPTFPDILILPELPYFVEDAGEVLRDHLLRQPAAWHKDSALVVFGRHDQSLCLSRKGLSHIARVMLFSSLVLNQSPQAHLDPFHSCF